MSVPFVRQFIRLFPNNYMNYVNMINNLDGDLSDVAPKSNTAEQKVTASYCDIDFTMTVVNEQVTYVKCETKEQGEMYIPCSFRVKTFTEVFTSLLIMLLLSRQEKPEKPKKK
jgi:hypothetical protein